MYSCAFDSYGGDVVIHARGKEEYRKKEKGLRAQ